jgi:RNA recognition motif-containing protein
MEANRSTLYVGDLPFNCQTADLYAFFERYGTLVKVKLIDHDRGTKRPHAQITFEKEEEGVSAMEDLT